MNMEFKILKKSKKSRARIGVIKQGYRLLETPAFLPVATQGSVKTLSSEDLEEIGFEGILANTYHLYLRPGDSLIKKFGGLHQFMNFRGVIVTDSGGFQVFSLGKGIEEGVGKIVKLFPGRKNLFRKKKKGFVKITENGVYFRSHLDGSKHFFSPEKSIRIQKNLGADIIFAFDECTSPFDDFNYTKKAMERTHLWAKRCLKEAQKLKLESKSKVSTGALFGIVQGGEYKELRRLSAKFIANLDFDGFGIGGSLGKTKKRMFEILDWTIPLLPENKPRHLLGIGYLEDIKKAVRKGIDLFDSCYPTRFARHGLAFSKEKGSEIKMLNLKKAGFLEEKKPLDESCQCFVCQNYSRGYLSHLFRAGELSCPRLLSYHNLWFLKKFMDRLREEIAKGKI